MTRPTVDQVLMHAAHLWEDRSTCSRNKVGAILAKDGRQIGSGYNGAPAGMEHCDHGAEPMPITTLLTPIQVPRLAETSLDRGCKVAIHAEANAIAYAARNGTPVLGGTLYSTLSPCYACAQLIIASGLKRVFYTRSYRDPAGIDLLRRGGVHVARMEF